ncbi:MAG: hypothetical protein PHF14_14330 [Verrucomicrobiota bacterium]|jgi:hypothetical protein|nr:hypothetical protein [Verrucomicrobiota bacterium]MDD8047637.1 hypothetical protein [Verrucomicrobiota bacterium]MDD8050607.1 hypothetical protein [Verrucomicrobiota bacterium]
MKSPVVQADRLPLVAPTDNRSYRGYRDCRRIQLARVMDQLLGSRIPVLFWIPPFEEIPVHTVVRSCCKSVTEACREP